MICPSCNGDGVIFLPFSTIVKKECKSIECNRCLGKGTVSEEMRLWIEQGEILKDRRIAKRLTLRKAARFLKMECSLLSDMERGIIKPNLDIQYYSMKVIKN